MSNKNKALITLSTAVALLMSGCAKDSGDTTDSGDTQYSINFTVPHAEGYFENATVCLDTNFNLRCDAGEQSAITDSKGKASIKPKDNTIPKSIFLVEIKKDTTTLTADGSKAAADMLIIDRIYSSGFKMKGNTTPWPSLVNNYGGAVYSYRDVSRGYTDWNDPDYAGTQAEKDAAIAESKASYLVELDLNSMLDTSGVVWADDDNGFVYFGTKSYLVSDICTGTYCGMIPAPADSLSYGLSQNTPTEMKDAIIGRIDFSQINAAVTKMRQTYADGTWQSTLKFPKRDSVN